MNNTMRNLTLTAAALAALVSIAPKAKAQDWSRTSEPVSPRGREFRGNQGREFRGHSESPRNDYRGHQFGGGAFRGHEGRGRGRGHGFFRPPAFFRSQRFFGRGDVSPYSVYGGYRGHGGYRTYAGSRFYSNCPGAGYVYVNELGWVYPPYAGAVWVSAYYDDDGYYVEGGWE